MKEILNQGTTLPVETVEKIAMENISIDCVGV